MVRPEPAKSPVANVPIFPPSLNASGELEHPRDRATVMFQGAMDNPSPQKHNCDEEEPERWDGMS